MPKIMTSTKNILIKIVNTSNPGKMASFKALLPKYGLSPQAVQAIKFTSLDLPEVIGDCETVSAMKAVMASKHHKTHGVLIDDTALDIEGEASAGINIRYLLDHEPEKFQSLIGRKAKYTSTLALSCENNIVQISQASVKGHIVPKPEKVLKGFGFEPIFKPVGSKKTLAENESDRVNARAIALKKLFAGKGKKIFFPWDEKTWQGGWQDLTPSAPKPAAK